MTAPDGQKIYVAFRAQDEKPCLYKADHSLWETLSSSRNDAVVEKELKQFCFLSGKDYTELFDKVDNEWFPVCRYLTFLATEDEEAISILIEDTKGKTISKIDVPIPYCEPDELWNVDYSDLSAVYRYRLMVEADLKNPHVYSDLEDIGSREKVILEKLKAACASEEAYKVWKKDVIDAKMKEVMEKQHIVTCIYLFAGIGQYKEMMPIEMVPSFKRWIDGNGSAFFGGYVDATKREIRTYVSHHIADELLGVEF